MPLKEPPTFAVENADSGSPSNSDGLETHPCCGTQKSALLTGSSGQDLLLIWTVGDGPKLAQWWATRRQGSQQDDSGKQEKQEDSSGSRGRIPASGPGNRMGARPGTDGGGGASRILSSMGCGEGRRGRSHGRPELSPLGPVRGWWTQEPKRI